MVHYQRRVWPKAMSHRSLGQRASRVCGAGETRIIQVHQNAWPRLPELLLATSYGIFLLTKIILVIALIIIYVIHVRVIRKDIEDQIMDNKMSEIQIQKLRKKIIILGEIMVVLSLAILFFASLLDAGV